MKTWVTWGWREFWPSFGIAFTGLTSEPGQNVTLPCRTPHLSVPIRAVVEWFRLDLQEGHVLMYRDEQFISMNQLPSFVNRVDLQDRQMKDRDVSLILKDVTSDDTGTFQCYVVQRGTNDRKSTVDHISTVYLRVVGSSDGHPAMKCRRLTQIQLNFLAFFSFLLKSIVKDI
uniref:Ig-like domain-containing protein n=1 Tax=Maylandia zebra TaxID=106582 RepID=A0A3P9CAY4_9CICH